MPQLTKGQKFIKSHKAQVKKASERAHWHKTCLDRATRRFRKIQAKIEDLKGNINTVKRQQKFDIKGIQHNHHCQLIQQFERWIEVLSDREEEIDNQVQYHRVLYHTHNSKYL